MRQIYFNLPSTAILKSCTYYMNSRYRKSSPVRLKSVTKERHLIPFSRIRFFHLQRHFFRHPDFRILGILKVVRLVFWKHKPRWFYGRLTCRQYGVDRQKADCFGTGNVLTNKLLRLSVCRHGNFIFWPPEPEFTGLSLDRSWIVFQIMYLFLQGQILTGSTLDLIFQH